jgi:hypothetical protein
MTATRGWIPVVPDSFDQMTPRAKVEQRRQIIEANNMVGVFYALAIWYTIIVVIVLCVYGLPKGDSIVFCFSLLATALLSEVDILSRHIGHDTHAPLGTSYVPHARPETSDVERGTPSPDISA